MHKRPGEVVVKVIKRHMTPYVFALFKIGIVAIPLYILIFIASGQTNMSPGLTLGIFALTSFLLGIVIVVVSIDYLMDKLIITNRRAIWVNWKSLWRREEHEAEFVDIQDIETREKGVLSKIKMFDYGFIEIETASTKTCITFHDCPDPEGVKHFILTQMEKQRGGIHEKREPLSPPKKENNDWTVN